MAVASLELMPVNIAQDLSYTPKKFSQPKIIVPELIVVYHPCLVSHTTYI